MASAFSSWETDPFFAAAEDVQQSADRMESAYRKWSSKRALAEETSLGKLNLNLCNNDVATALDTTKWQLEEFTKAVTQSDAFLRGEDVSKWHISFINAIWNQIVLIEETIRNCIDARLPNPSHSIKLNGEERDQLEMFLSGGGSVAKDLSAQEVNHHVSLLPSSKTRVPGSNMKRPVCVGLVCDHPGGTQVLGSSSSLNDCYADICPSNTLPAGNCGRTGIFLSSHLSNMVCIPRQCNACSGITEAGIVHEEEPIEAQTLRDDKRLSRHTDVVHSVQSADISFGDLHGKKLHGVIKPPTYRIGFKRWKSGTLCIDVDDKEDATRWCKDVRQPDIEGGYFSGDSRSHRQNSFQSAGRWRLQRSLVARYMAVCKFSGRRASCLLVLLCLCCMYLWFLSSLVPYINTVFPHKFAE